MKLRHTRLQRFTRFCCVQGILLFVCVQVKYKTKMLGNIRLVGELIRHGMLRTQPKAVVGCSRA